MADSRKDWNNIGEGASKGTDRENPVYLLGALNRTLPPIVPKAAPEKLGLASTTAL